MKQGTLITKIVMLILFAGVAVYLAVYAFQSLTDPFASVMAYQDSLDDSLEITGVVVRQEQLLSDGSAIMDIIPDEGERVAGGDPIAVLYQNSTALERKKELQRLEQELAQLEYALNNGNSLSDAAKLEQQIIESILTLRSDAAGGEFSSLENDALSLRTQILQHAFAYSASGDSASALAEGISRLTGQIAQLKQQAASDTSSIVSPHSGLFSAGVDGLESVLTPTALETMTAGELSAYIGADATVEGTPVGKLITGDRWYFAAVVDAAAAKRLLAGDTITVAFSKDFTGEIDMRVERIESEDGGDWILVLSSNRHLKDMTMLRTQTVKLIFERYTGVRVPKEALHMETVVRTDEETGQETESQMIGVYTVVGGQAEFNLVDIVREGSDYYLLTPSKDARTYAITTVDGKYRLYVPIKQSELHILRAGDQVITADTGLYDGKVVLE